MAQQTEMHAVQALYATAERTRSAFAGDRDRAVAYYQDYVGFVCGVCPPEGRSSIRAKFLDVGCGCGWSSYALCERGYEVTGVDLNGDAFEPPPTPFLTLREASMLELPFPDGAFDAVGTYQCLEHVPDPEAGLRELLRVCKPGGMVCIVGPNLISPLHPALELLRRGSRVQLPLRRRAGMPRHPYGNTAPEMLASIPLSAARLASKALSSEPSFTMREPDTAPPFIADNDACYLCCPADLKKFFARQGCSIVRNGKPGRSPALAAFAAGTWVAAQKPSA